LDWILWAIGAAAAVLLGAGLVSWQKRRRQPMSRVRRIAADTLDDVVIPDGLGAEIHVPHLYLSGAGIFVAEFRELNGTLFAGERLERWTVMEDTRRYAISNPLEALERRVQAVRLLAPAVPVHGRIVLIGEVEYGSGQPDGVVALPAFLKEMSAGGGPTATAVGAFHGPWERIRAATV
jgi:hypothetical protein